MSKRVAIVTGSNKGIGLAIVEGLLKKFDGIVYLTSRDVKRGQDAVECLKAKGLNPMYHQLDITDKASVEALLDHLKTTYGGIDVLVNNAGIAYKQAATEPAHIQARNTIDVNYYGTKQCCEVLFPLLNDGARVVNVSSSVGFLGNYGDGKSEANKAIRAKLALSDSTLTVPELDGLMEEFITATQVGRSRGARLVAVDLRHLQGGTQCPDENPEPGDAKVPQKGRSDQSRPSRIRRHGHDEPQGPPDSGARSRVIHRLCYYLRDRSNVVRLLFGTLCTDGAIESSTSPVAIGF